MRIEIPINDAIGKTLEGVAFGLYFEQAVLAFTDGTFSTLQAHNHGDGDLSIAPATLDLTAFGDRELAAVGVATLQEIDDFRDARDAMDNEKRLKQEEARDRAEFERLKRKYGDG